MIKYFFKFSVPRSEGTTLKREHLSNIALKSIHKHRSYGLVGQIFYTSTGVVARKQNQDRLVEL